MKVYIFDLDDTIIYYPNNIVNYNNIMTALILNLTYFVLSIFVFYSAFSEARKKGTLINVGE